MPTGHYNRRRTPPEVRFWRHVEKQPAGCWLWTAGKRSGGYGNASLTPSRSAAAHRLSWEMHCGPIPPGMCVLHDCDKPPCVNPAHLFLGDRLVNNADKVEKGRQARGERAGMAKLTAETVRLIVERLRRGESQTSIARSLGVHPSTISNIARGACWTHVTGFTRKRRETSAHRKLL